MVKSFIYDPDNRGEAMDTIRGWFNNDPRVSFRIDDVCEKDETTGMITVNSVLVALLPTFADGNLYVAVYIKPGRKVSVQRTDVWPVVTVGD